MSISSIINQYSNSREVKAVGIYTFSNFFNKGVSFLLLFYFTNVLTQSDFGMLSLFSNAILFVMPLVSLGILQSVNADFFKLEKVAFKNFFTTTLTLPVAASLIIILLLLIFKQSLQTVFHFPTIFIFLIPIIALLGFIYELLIMLIRNNEQPMQYLWVNIVKLLIEIIVAVIFISVIHYGWLGRVLGILVSSILLGVYALYYFIRNNYLFGDIKKVYIKSELSYAIPIITMQLSVFCLGSSAVYYINHFTNSMQTVGIYSVAVTLASVVNVFCIALLQYVQPKLYKLLAQKKVDHKAIKKLFSQYIICMTLFTILMIGLVPLVYHFLLKQTYVQGLQYCYLLCIGHFIWGIAYFFFLRLLYYKEKKKILILSIIAILVSIIFNCWLTSNQGAKGAAIATVASYATILLIVCFFVKPFIVAMMQNYKPSTII